MAKKEIPKLNVESRSKMGSRYSARLRKVGKLPAVIYGHGQEPVHVTASRKDVVDLLHHHAHLIEVNLDSKAEPCLVKDVQWDHLGSTIIHVDLTRVDLTQKVRVDVGVELTGDAIGLKEAGTILEQTLTQIEIECLATEIPESIKADVSHLVSGKTLTIKELKLPVGVKATLGGDTIIAAVRTLVEETTPAAGAEGVAEPEVIGKKAEEGAEAAADEKKK